jgi:hypothetical protein
MRPWWIDLLLVFTIVPWGRMLRRMIDPGYDCDGRR